MSFFYHTNLAALVAGNGLVAYRQHRLSSQGIPQPTLETGLKESTRTGPVAKFQRQFFGVYLLVVAADWLQGPYIYTLYKDEKGFDASAVAALFTTGFVSAAVTASFVGSLADKYGRRLACLMFCASYSVSCLSVLSNDYLVLASGRVLGGLSTTLMYSVFETWMVTEYHARELAVMGLSLSKMFGAMTTGSSIVAILAGVSGEGMVSYTGTKKTPFLAAVACLVVAGGSIATSWNENHGQTATEKTSAHGTGARMVLADRRVLALGLVSTFFEGTMYLFIFFWAPTLHSSRSLSGTGEARPFGVIFAAFMSAMMLGSMIFTGMKLSEFDFTPTARLVQTILALASSSLLFTVLSRSEWTTFWAFGLFEVCVGLYFPSMAALKGRIVDDAVRAKVYGVLRLPLNVFVVIALSLTREGDVHRDRVFIVCGSLLLVAFFAVQRWLLN